MGSATFGRGVQYPAGREEKPFKNIIIRPGHFRSQWVVRTTNDDNRNEDKSPGEAATYQERKVERASVRYEVLFCPGENGSASETNRVLSLLSGYKLNRIN